VLQQHYLYYYYWEYFLITIYNHVNYIILHKTVVIYDFLIKKLIGQLLLFKTVAIDTSFGRGIFSPLFIGVSSIKYHLLVECNI